MNIRQAVGVTAMAVVISGIGLGAAAWSQPERPNAGGGPGGAGPGGGGQMAQMGQAMIRELRQVEGCLSAEAGTFAGNRFVIMAWFENKAAAKRWYDHPMHRRLQAGSGLGGAGGEPMEDIPDDVPVLALASMTFGGQPIEGSQIPFSGISIELYTPLKQSLRVGTGFAPDEFFKK